MKDVIRFDIDRFDCEITQCSWGNFVAYSDYKELEIENESLKTALTNMKQQHDRIVGALRDDRDGIMKSYRITLEELHAMEVNIAKAGDEIDNLTAERDAALAMAKGDGSDE